MSQTYYFSDKTNDVIQGELLDKKASKIAESFFPRRRDGKLEPYALSPTQLRRFFSDFQLLRKKYEVFCAEKTHEGLNEKNAKSAAFPRIHPHIKMVKSKAAYASDKIPRTFEAFLKDSIDEIQDYQDFEAFLLHFEAVVGFSKKYSNPKSNT